MNKYDNKRTATPIRERILNKIIIDANDCWIWQGKYFNKWGYSKIVVGSRRDGSRRSVFTHRASYEAFIDKIGDNLQIHHLCNNTKCVNPDHLQPLTAAEHNKHKTRLSCGICGTLKEHKYNRLVCLPCQRKRVREYMRRRRSKS